MLTAKRTVMDEVIIRSLPRVTENSRRKNFLQIKSRGLQERFLWLQPLLLRLHAPP
jgi:hypothetical protein